MRCLLCVLAPLFHVIIHSFKCRFCYSAYHHQSIRQTPVGKYKLTYLRTLVGSTNLATIINLPSGSPFFIFHTLRILFRTALLCLAIQSAVPLINRTTLATPQHEELIHKLRNKYHAGGKYHLQMCWYQCDPSQCVPLLYLEGSGMALLSTRTFKLGTQSRTQ